MGEFGRTPRINNGQPGIPIPGRDHWGDAISVMLAGGGIRGGQVVGATNAKAEHPVDRPLKPHDLLATVYHVMGMDPTLSFPDRAGRPIPILTEGEPSAKSCKADRLRSPDRVFGAGLRPRRSATAGLLPLGSLSAHAGAGRPSVLPVACRDPSQIPGLIRLGTTGLISTTTTRNRTGLCQDNGWYWCSFAWIPAVKKQQPPLSPALTFHVLFELINADDLVVEHFDFHQMYHGSAYHGHIDESCCGGPTFAQGHSIRTENKLQARRE